MKLSKLLLAFTFMMMAFSVAYGQYHSGGRGLMYVHSARTLSKGSLESYFHTRFFGNIGKFRQEYLLDTYWDVQASFAFNYGLNDRFELSLLPVVYQDTNQSGTGYNLPDDLFLKIKYGDFGKPSSKIKYGLQLSTRVPLGEKHNVLFEPYSAGTLEFGIAGLASYTGDALFPDESFNLHFNLGLLSHNDAGSKLSESDADTLSNGGASSEILYALGFRYPFEKMSLTLELHGNSFLKQPAASAYSRENYLYLTPGLSYEVSDLVRFDLAADVRLSSDKDETDYTFVRPTPPEVPNSFPGWRINAGLKLTIFPASSYRRYESELAVDEVVTRREMFEKMVREMEEQENAAKDLGEVTQERKKAEREAERLRKKLERKNRKKQDQF